MIAVAEFMLFLPILTSAVPILETNTETPAKAPTDDFPVLGETDCAHCPSVYVPVCTKNDLTFANECRVKCFNDLLRKLNKRTVEIAYYGTCVTTFVQVGVQVPADDADADYTK